MGIAEANLGGNVHGGVIMPLCDKVAGIAAFRHSGRRVVTAAISGSSGAPESTNAAGPPGSAATR